MQTFVQQEPEESPSECLFLSFAIFILCITKFFSINSQFYIQSLAINSRKNQVVNMPMVRNEIESIELFYCSSFLMHRCLIHKKKKCFFVGAKRMRLVSNEGFVSAQWAIETIQLFARRGETACLVHLILSGELAEHRTERCNLQINKCLFCFGQGHSVSTCLLKKKRLQYTACYRCFFPTNGPIIMHDASVKPHDCPYEVLRTLIFAGCRKLWKTPTSTEDELFEYLWGKEARVHNVPRGAIILAKYLNEKRLV